MEKLKLALSTSNKNKVKEIKEILKDLEIEVIAKSDLGIPDFDVLEDGSSLEENSLKKAEELRKRIKGTMVMADDSGLFVKELGGEPGVHSSRYGGKEGDDKANIELLLENIKNLKDPVEAEFRTVISLINPQGQVTYCRGICKGRIIREERGEFGFGYDPIFIPEGYEKTFAEMLAREKNEISHRKKALLAMEKEIEKYLKNLSN